MQFVNYILSLCEDKKSAAFKEDAFNHLMQCEDAIDGNANRRYDISTKGVRVDEG